MISERDFVLNYITHKNIADFDLDEIKKIYRDICENTSEELPNKKEKIQAVIDKLNKKHFMRTEEIVEMLEDLKNGK